MAEESPDPRERIVEAAFDLLTEGGREAVSTRAVCRAAGVQAPTIYRQFGDMQGLLDAVAERGFIDYVERKTRRTAADDPVEDVRNGWDLHVEFGLANPAVYALMYGNPEPGRESPVARQAGAILEGLLRRVAEAGRLRTSVERATRVVSGAGRGVTLSLISTPAETRDPMVSTIVREAVLSAITTGGSEDMPPIQGQQRAAQHAVGLRETMGEAADVLSPSERGLLEEWLDRLSAAGARSGSRDDP